MVYLSHRHNNSEETNQMRHIVITILVFLALSLVFITISEAPFKVHVVDISALFVAFVIPSIISIMKDNKNQKYIWLVGATIGLLYWDILFSSVIVKRELFMGWYVIYPIGIGALYLLQIITMYAGNLLPYNKSLEKDAT